MKLIVNFLHLIKADNLISNNEFLSSYLTEDASGGWFINTNDKDKLLEIERLLKKNNIKYKIINV